MRIILDFSPAVYHHAGIGRYASELLLALVRLDRTEEYCLFYNAPHGDERPDPSFRHLPTRTVRQSAKQWRLRVLLAYLTGAPMDRILPECDVFHATDNVLPPLRGAGTVLTVYDLTVLLFPEYHLLLNRWYVSLMLRHFLERADAVIAVSENTRRDIVRLLQVPQEKMAVVPLGVNGAFRPIQDEPELRRVCDKYALPSQFLLYLGTIEPRKNLLTLLEAYRTLLARGSPMPDLVIAGKRGWQQGSIGERVRQWGLESHVHFTGWVEDSDVPALLSSAAVFVYPSLYEGFGLPPLEAMACGTPVICSNASSLPEVVGDAGILVDPRDVRELAEAMSSVLGNPTAQADLRARGLKRARQFSWERAASETLEVYKAAASKRDEHLP